MGNNDPENIYRGVLISMTLEHDYLLVQNEAGRRSYDFGRKVLQEAGIEAILDRHKGVCANGSTGYVYFTIPDSPHSFSFNVLGHYCAMDYSTFVPFGQLEKIKTAVHDRGYQLELLREEGHEVRIRTFPTKAILSADYQRAARKLAELYAIVQRQLPQKKRREAPVAKRL